MANVKVDRRRDRLDYFNPRRRRLGLERLVRRLGGKTVDAFSELNYRARIESLITEREGMIAENKQREQLGQSMAYPEREFMRIVHEFSQIQLDLRSGN